MVLELPELTCENQDWKMYHAHILNSTAVEGVVSHLSGAALKPVDSHKLKAWNSSNAVAKYIILEVITDSLLEWLMHHELAHTLFSHLAAIFGDHEPIAIEPPVEWNHQDEPLHEDSHPKSDSTYSACTTEIVEGIDVEWASAATEIIDTLPYKPDRLSSMDRSQEMEHNVHNTNCDKDLTSLPFELKTTEFHDEKPSGTTPAGIPSIPNTNWGNPRQNLGQTTTQGTLRGKGGDRTRLFECKPKESLNGEPLGAGLQTIYTRIHEGCTRLSIALCTVHDIIVELGARLYDIKGGSAHSTMHRSRLL